MSVLKTKDGGGNWTSVPSIKGDTGDAAGFGTVVATVDANHGTPSVTVTTSGDDTAKNFDFAFHNLQPAPYDDSELQQDFATLQAQFDTAVSAVTTDTEVTDIRVGADGITGTTAGASVRRQFTDLKSDIINLADAFELDYFYTSTISGTKLAGVNCSVPIGKYRLRIDNIVSSDTDATTCKILLYNASNSIVLDKTYPRGQKIDDEITVSSPITHGYVYASDSANNAIGDTFAYTNFRICTINLETELAPISDMRRELFTAQSHSNIDAYLNVSGNRVSNVLYETTQPFPVKSGEKIYYNLFHNSASLPIIALYTNANDTSAIDKVFVTADATYRTGIYTVPNDGFIRICFAKTGTDSYAYFYDGIADNVKVYCKAHGSYTKLFGKNVCILGDSIAYGTGATSRATDSWAVKFAEMTGANVTNLAVGGSSLQYRASAETEAKSVYTVSTETDFTEYDICIIAAGTNDILGTAGTPESTGNDNACGALKLIIENVMTSNPLIQIIFFTPMFRARYSPNDTLNSDDNAYNGIYLYELADNLEIVARSNHVPCKNMYRQFLCNKYNASSILADGLHPNNIGHARLSNVYADFIESNI